LAGAAASPARCSPAPSPAYTPPPGTAGASPSPCCSAAWCWRPRCTRCAGHCGAATGGPGRRRARARSPRWRCCSPSSPPPRRNSRAGHFGVLIVGTLLYRYLLTAAAMPRLLLAVLLALPLAGAVLVDLREGDEVDVETAGVGVLIVVWLLAALLLSFEA